MKNKIVPKSLQGRIESQRCISLFMNFILMGVFFLTAVVLQARDEIIPAPERSGVKMIVSDIGDVLFKTSKVFYAQRMLAMLVYNPSLLYWIMKNDPKDAYYKFLETIPAKSTQPVYSKGKLRPFILSDWQCGLQTPEEIKNLVEAKIKASQESDAIKNLYYTITDLMFNPETLVASQKIVTPMVELLEKHKKAGYQIGILSNWDVRSFNKLKETYPDLFKLCDHISISGTEHLSKPNPESFKQFLRKSNVTASECVFIDDEPHNIAAASQLGFKTIQYTDPEKTKELMRRTLLGTR